MSTATALALAVGGVVVVGGVVYFVTRPGGVALPRAGKPLPSRAAAAPVGSSFSSLVTGIGAGIGGGLVNLFKGSSGNSTFNNVSNQPVPPAPVTAAQGMWNAAPEEQFDQLRAADDSMGVEGPF